MSDTEVDTQVDGNTRHQLVQPPKALKVVIVEDPPQAQINQQNLPALNPENQIMVLADRLDKIEKKRERSRAWMLTINNPTQVEFNNLHNLEFSGATYVAFQLEAAPTTGTLHFQVFMYYKNAVGFKGIKKKFPTANIGAGIEGATNEDRIAYCTREFNKDGTRKRLDLPNGQAGPWEIGIKPSQGERRDLDELAKEFLTKSTEEFIEANPGAFVRYNKGLQTLKYHSTKHRAVGEPPVVIWIWGIAGCGKTSTAYNAHKNAYIKDGSMWWDLYEHNESIIIDDFDGKWPYRDLLRLLDRYPYQGQVKGGFIKITSPYIYITCEYPPEHFWNGNELAQITRRLTEVRKMGNGPDYVPARNFGMYMQFQPPTPPNRTMLQ